MDCSVEFGSVVFGTLELSLVPEVFFRRGERREVRAERGENTSGSGRCESHYHATIGVKRLPEVPELPEVLSPLSSLLSSLFNCVCELLLGTILCSLTQHCQNTVYQFIWGRGSVAAIWLLKAKMNIMKQ